MTWQFNEQLAEYPGNIPFSQIRFSCIRAKMAPS